jgi:hypothetical protein
MLPLVGAADQASRVPVADGDGRNGVSRMIDALSGVVAAAGLAGFGSTGGYGR